MVVACVALRDAVRWYGHETPGLLVDPAGHVSPLGLPSWEGRRLGLRFPDRVEPRDLPATVAGSRARVEHWDRAVAAASGRGFVDAVIRRGAEARAVRLPLQPLDPAAFWAYAGSLILAGLACAGAGLLALWSKPDGRIARAFASVALTGGLFMLSFFDAHTTRELTPVMQLSFACLPVQSVRLMLHLPTRARLLTRHGWLEHVLVLGGLGLGLFTIATYRAGGEIRGLEELLTLNLGVGLVLFVAGLGVRYVLAPHEQRPPLSALLVSLLPPYAGIALLFVLPRLDLSLPDFLLYPALVLAPLATLYSFVRHDLWGTRALLSRVGTNVVLGALAALVAIGAGTAVAAWLGAKFSDALAGAAASGVAAAVLVALSLRVSDFTLFRSRAEYKPTIDRLSEELVTLSSPKDVAHAVERTVRRWLRCDFIELTLAPRDGTNVAPAHDTDALAGASPSETDEPPCPPEAALRLVVAFGGKPYGWLDVGGKRGGALFTSDDIDLLRTIANHGGLALAHAHAYQELEDRRRRQAEAWRGEREALVETVAAEIAHEIRYPLNYFRSLFERGGKSGRLTADDIDVGSEEVDRLERLVAGLKRMVAHRIERGPTSIAELCRRVDALLRDSLGKLAIEVELAPDATLNCDPDKLTQVLVNLISNAVEACGPNGRAGITWSHSPQGGELSVWDDGPGFGADAARLFAPWYTTKQRGTGLGLAITHRLVRAHGWTIAAQRREGRTVFAIAVRGEDILRDALIAAGERESRERVRVA
jgi:signal transduction histidine kinase